MSKFNMQIPCALWCWREMIAIVVVEKCTICFVGVYVRCTIKIRNLIFSLIYFQFNYCLVAFFEDEISSQGRDIE